MSIFSALGKEPAQFLETFDRSDADDATWTVRLISTLIGIPILGLFWWLAAQLIYIAGMASIDVLRCFLAIERNTRR